MGYFSFTSLQHGLRLARLGFIFIVMAAKWRPTVPKALSSIPVGTGDLTKMSTFSAGGGDSHPPGGFRNSCVCFSLAPFHLGFYCCLSVASGFRLGSVTQGCREVARASRPGRVRGPPPAHDSEPYRALLVEQFVRGGERSGRRLSIGHLLGLANNHYRTRRTLRNILHSIAKQQCPQAPLAMSAKHNHLDFQFLGNAQDLLPRDTDSHQRFHIHA